MSEQDTPFSEWLERQYLQWQMRQGSRATLGEFADYLGISRAVLSHYMNGIRKPSGQNVARLAARLGPETYDLLGLQRPDPNLQFITRYWHTLQPKEQQFLVEQVKQYTETNQSEGNK